MLTHIFCHARGQNGKELIVLIHYIPVALALTTCDDIDSSVFNQVIESVKFLMLCSYAQAVPVLKHKTDLAM